MLIISRTLDDQNNYLERLSADIGIILSQFYTDKEIPLPTQSNSDRIHIKAMEEM